MPYKFETDKTPLPAGKDRRVKLTDRQRDEIAANIDGLSQRQLAALYGVSRRTIQFVLNPEALQENKQRRKERGGWRQYYDKDSHTETMREHRQYKRKVLKDDTTERR